MTCEHSKTVANALMALVGRNRKYTVEFLANATDIPQQSLYAMRAGTYAPRYVELMALVGVLGPSFTNMLLASVGQGGAHEISDSPADANATISHMAGSLSDLCTANEDGRIDHRERRQLAPSLRELGCHLIETACAFENDNVTMFPAAKGAAE